MNSHKQVYFLFLYLTCFIISLVSINACSSQKTESIGFSSNMDVLGKASKMDDTAYIMELEEKAKNNNALAQYELGKIYYDGIGVNRSHKKAQKYWDLAANNGYAKAQYSLGYLYFNGEGILLDFKEGCKWLKKAKDQNYPDATLLYKKKCIY